MRRRSTSGKPVKARRRKAATLKRGNAPKAVRRRSPSIADLKEQLDRRTHERDEALEQQAATSEVLGVISNSRGDLKPVFDAMLANAVHLCEARFGNLLLFDGSAMRMVARHNAPGAFDEMRRRDPVIPLAQSILGVLVRTHKLVHVHDLVAEEPFANSPLAKVAGARTALAVPMLRGGDLVGAISVYRQNVKPFTDRQVDLLTNFASQAVIAIENAQLLTELRQRTTDLTESLEQQTATSEVLQVISSSPSNLEPVFATMLEKAARICEANFGNIHRWDGDALHLVATHNTPPGFAEFRRRSPIRSRPENVIGRTIATKMAVHVADLAAEQGYIEQRDPGYVAAVELGGVRTFLAVPMLKENELIGLFTLYRQEVRPFTDKQIELVKNFAAQAVIAIENARLLNELRQRTDDLTESLEQQTATSEVLRVISSSPGDFQPVFATMLENAVRICDATFGNIYRWENEALHLMASHNVPAAFAEARTRTPSRPSPQTPTGRMIATKTFVHVPDLAAEPAYAARDPWIVDGVELAGVRTLLIVPMMKENELIGAFTIYRQQVRPFTDKQIQLVQNFAAQAVIAIENARLLTELRESLQQQTATADVLKVISRSTFDLQAVLQTLVESAARLCGADKAVITRQKGEVFYRAESYGFSSEFMDRVRDSPVEPGRGTASGRALLEGRAVHIPDVQIDPEYTFEALRFDAYRTILGVPMLREGVPIGVLALTRSEVRPFTDKQIELVSTFADQAAIAIENVRLFESVEARTRELAQSLEDLRTTQDRLVQTEKLASLGQLTAGIAHEIKNPLNFVNNFSAVSVELIDELREALGGVHLDSKLRAEISEIADMLQGNLDKVVQHGKRADAIVKNMLLHSRQGSGEHRPVDVNALVEESLNLAYHGARAEKQGFEITLERSFDPAAGEADLFPQEITRALLNLISNGFYAATKRQAEANGGNYEPTLAAATKNLGDWVEIRIRDNGTGIPSEVKEKLFNPFFTTKPAGEGTGLGLSISHDIIVKQHGGSIDVDTKPGEFTEFRIVLPRAGMALTKPGERASH